MSGEKSDETSRPLVCPTCARPFEDEQPARPPEDEQPNLEPDLSTLHPDLRMLAPDRYRTDGRGLTWIKLGGMELE